MSRHSGTECSVLNTSPTALRPVQLDRLHGPQHSAGYGMPNQGDSAFAVDESEAWIAWDSTSLYQIIYEEVLATIGPVVCRVCKSRGLIVCVCVCCV